MRISDWSSDVCSSDLAHGGRSLFRDEVRGGAVLADRLALALLQPQPADELGADQQADDKRRQRRRARPEGEVPDEVENPRKTERLGQFIENFFSLNPIV